MLKSLIIKGPGGMEGFKKALGGKKIIGKVIPSAPAPTAGEVAQAKEKLQQAIRPQTRKVAPVSLPGMPLTGTMKPSILTSAPAPTAPPSLGKIIQPPVIKPIGAVSTVPAPRQGIPMTTAAVSRSGDSTVSEILKKKLPLKAGGGGHSPVRIMKRERTIGDI